MAFGTADLFGASSGAAFSACRRYRYRLWRRWDSSRPSLGFLMLNPSQAAEEANDPTVERCQRRALMWGYGSLEVVNLFALVATDPRRLYAPDVDPIGAENDEHIAAVATSCALLICAWSLHGRLRDRERQVIELLRRCGVTPHVLMLNKDGTPRHPLYVSYEVTPVPWVSADGL